MNFLKNILRGRDIKNIFLQNVPTLPSQRLEFRPIDTHDVDGQWEAYARTPVLNTIINRIAQLASNAVYYVENQNNEIINTLKGRELINILNKPSAGKTFEKFIENCFINLKIYGEVFILPITLEGLSGYKGLICLPNRYTSIMMDYTNYPFAVTQNNFIRSILYTNPDGFTVDLTQYKDDLIIINEIEHNQYPTRGISKLYSLQDHINKYLITVNAANDLLQNYGAIGMWVNEGTDGIGTAMIDPKEKEKLQNVLEGEYGLTRGKNKHYITSLKLKHEKISLPISDLMIDEINFDSVKAICDSIGYSIDLLSNHNGSSLTASGGREAEAKRQVVNETIEPFMNNLANSLQFMLEPNIKLSFYYDHLPFMQESEKEKAELNNTYVDLYSKLLQNGTITPDELKNKLINLEILK